MGADASSYEALPYAGRVHPNSHIDVLATIGTLLGMQPASPARCRVLGLGCGDGTNLIVMAYHFPDSHFVGVDASPSQIQHGQALAAGLGLDNITLVAGDIRSLPGVEGDFDYIVTHGVFSWVPDDVRAAILKTCQERLRPQGIAYVSYNCYPGWHMFDQLRAMMRYHAHDMGSIKDDIDQARAIVQFIGSTMSVGSSARAVFFERDVPPVLQMDDDYLFHEYLEPENTPLYFHQFASMAEHAGLQYLGDAQFYTMMTTNLGEDASRTVDNISRSIIDTEQYSDFVRNRRFRCSLLCRPEVTVERAIGYDPVLKMRIASALVPAVESPDIFDGQPLVFSAPSDPTATLTVSHPLEKRALQVLVSRWPEAVPFAELVAACCPALGLAPDAPNQTVLAAVCFQLLATGSGELHIVQPPVTGHVLERPQTTRLARHQLAAGLRPCSQRHLTVNLSAQGRALLALLDGTRTLPQIVGELSAAWGEDEAVVADKVAQLLAQIAGCGLLIPEGSEPVGS